jgi:hypothetical protein
LLKVVSEEVERSPHRAEKLVDQTLRALKTSLEKR